MKSKLILIFGFITVFLLMAIGVESRAASEQYVIYLPIVAHDTFVIPPPIIPTTTKALPATTTQYLTSISLDGSIFTFSQITPDLQALDVGDIIAGEIAAVAPNGFLRKVISISLQGGQVIVTTADTVLEEAIQQGGFVYNTTLSPSNIASSKQLEGVTLVSDTGSFFININNVILYDDDGNTNTTNDQITANGNVELESAFNIGVSVEDFTLKELYFSQSVDETASIEIESVVTLASLHTEKELARYDLAPITVPIGGWFPVVFTPVLVVNVGMDGSIHLGVTASASQETKYTAGLDYKSSAWNFINNLTNSFLYTSPTLTAGLDAKAYAGAELSLLLYGVVGPDAEAQAYLELEADPLATPWWVLYGGLEAKVGIEFEILSHVVAGYEATVLDYRVVLTQASGGIGTPTPTPSPTPTPNPTATPGAGSWQEVGAGSASGGGISNDTEPSNNASIAIAPDGMPYVAWGDYSSVNREIYVRAWNGSSWVEVGAGSASGGGISNNATGSSFPSMAIAPDGTPYVAWWDHSDVSSEIYLRAWNGISWEEVGAGSASGGGISNTATGSSSPSMAIAPNGTPYVTWTTVIGTGNYEIYVRAWDGSSWIEVGAGSASGGGISNNPEMSIESSIAIALDGTPYVAWRNGNSGDNEIYVRAWNGSSWIEVGAGSASGGGISNNAGGSYHPSLAIAPDGTPYVAWSDDSSGNGEIYVRVWNGSVWAEVGAGSASGGGISNNTGYSAFASLVIAPDGRPYVAWFDESGGDDEIYIRAWDGSSWVEVGTGSASGGGVSNNAGESSQPSLAISPDGTPYMAWGDDSAGDYEIYVKQYIE